MSGVHRFAVTPKPSYFLTDGEMSHKSLYNIYIYIYLVNQLVVKNFQQLAKLLSQVSDPHRCIQSQVGEATKPRRTLRHGLLSRLADCSSQAVKQRPWEFRNPCCGLDLVTCYKLRVCVCAPCNHRDSVELLFSFLARGQSHFAADCPTKRAASVADIRKGRLLDVPAWLWR